MDEINVIYLKILISLKTPVLFSQQYKNRLSKILILKYLNFKESILWFTLRK